jgi:hypothetical protein
MIQNPPHISVSADRLIQVLGTEIARADLTQIQSQTQILSIMPGQSFWQSRDGQPGVYIIVAGKVRLFDLHDRRVATLTVGKSFGASTLFPDADFNPYSAKAALVVGGVEILVGFIPNDCIQSWWGKYPEIQSHLSQHAQHLDAILSGEIEPSALQIPQRGLQPQPPLSRQISPLVSVTPQASPPAQPIATTAPDRFKQAYFPTPSQKMGHWWKKVTHTYPFYAQHSASDCSAACMVMVGRYWGREFNINQGVKRHPVIVGQLYPLVNQAQLLTNVRLWTDGVHRTNLVLATVRGAKDSWAVITDESPSLQTLRHYSLRFCVEELFLDSKSGAFGLTDSRLRNVDAINRLYLIAAVALLYATTTGLTVQMTGLRTTVDPHWRRGLSYLKIGLRYLRGVINKGRKLLRPTPLRSRDPEPCFNPKAELDFSGLIWFSRISTITCNS